MATTTTVPEKAPLQVIIFSLLLGQDLFDASVAQKVLTPIFAQPYMPNQLEMYRRFSKLPPVLSAEAVAAIREWHADRDTVLTVFYDLARVRSFSALVDFLRRHVRTPEDVLVLAEVCDAVLEKLPNQMRDDIARQVQETLTHWLWIELDVPPEDHTARVTALARHLAQLLSGPVH